MERQSSSVRDNRCVTETDFAQRVTTLELFFDLVFVFTLTQLTTVLFESPNGRGLLEVVLMLVVIWWMYGGYAWLTNAVRADTASRRLLLFAAMGAYFVLALSVPKAFDGAGLAFGIAYLLIVLIHAALFTQSTAASVVTAILSLAPYNVAAALVVVAGGAAGGTLQYALWALAGAFEWLTPMIRGTSGFLVGPAHFVERHGLVVIVAIGESVVAVGIGAAGLPVDADLVLSALLGLALSAGLWWSYFGVDEDAAERALAAAPMAARPGLAIEAFGYWHLPILLGVIGVATALKTATGQAFDALPDALAIALGGGAAIFLLGEALYRRTLAIGGDAARAVTALLALATIPIGTGIAAMAQLAVLVCLFVALLAATPSAPPPSTRTPARRGRRTRRRGSPTASTPPRGPAS
jgi:low temperature requirement protein LtrA